MIGTNYKKLVGLLCAAALILGLSACGENTPPAVPTPSPAPSDKVQATPPAPSDNDTASPSEMEDTPMTLVVYFSATNTTRPLAEYAADILNDDLYQITPEKPYTEADLAYYTNGPADQEQSNPNARPAISGSVDNMDDYDIVFIGYPI